MFNTKQLCFIAITIFMLHSYKTFAMEGSLAHDLVQFNDNLGAYDRRYNDLITENEWKFRIGAGLATGLIGSTLLWGNVVAKAVRHHSGKTILKQSATIAGLTGLSCVASFFAGDLINRVRVWKSMKDRRFQLNQQESALRRRFFNVETWQDNVQPLRDQVGALRVFAQTRAEKLRQLFMSNLARR